ncbi:hypothetical protein [Microvirga alba]|uniref:Stability/partitioning determinant n=1 Tax=Microvirga alba TaxID=2791025 RepID=A0A931FUH7_9HYPH|nr:hypothetical protein [Microvirga alba]MBF9235626.1 hypothetical protein [Microvirga alba]
MAERRKIDVSLEMDDIPVTPRQASPGAKDAAKAVAQASGFDRPTVPTEAPAPAPGALAAPIPAQSPTRASRQRITGRTEQFTVKLRPDTRELIYRLVDQLRLKTVADVMELAFERLEQDRQAGKVTPR